LGFSSPGNNTFADSVFDQQLTVRKQYENKYEINLAKGDTWPAKVNGKMMVPASQPDDIQNATDRISPAYKNSNTPLWDGSQI
jgi:hypothetical protein